eukprot:CAMPEP_0170540776 /NCGR_PEP_ID=MMETSP0211-20121228/717_1 /TAXON_ID=311385 /ORGANISM="Pseudokeronopsis sp., Strain OXSARD2" /LENGTH=42 /DNA_ID= /DNA_START= /DNA_END= /DNA_ORIENTATION=
MKGNTLKARHNKVEGKIDFQRKKVLAKFLTSRENEKSEKEKC